MTTAKAKKTLSATRRELLGKKVKQLRKDGLVPANVYGQGEKSIAITLNLKEVEKMYAEAGDTQVVYLSIDGESKAKPVLFDEIQLAPITSMVEHIALRQVNLKEKIEAMVPVVLTGENKIAGAVVVTVHDEVEVEALPTDLPEEFVIEIDKLTEVGQAVTFADLEYDKELVTLKVSEEEMETPVVVLQEVKEEVEEVATEEVADEAAGEEKPAENNE